MRIVFTAYGNRAGDMRFSREVQENRSLLDLMHPAKSGPAPDAVQVLVMMAELQRAALATYGPMAAPLMSQAADTLKSLIRLLSEQVAPTEKPAELDADRLSKCKGFPLDVVQPYLKVTSSGEREAVGCVFRAYWAGPTATTALIEIPSENGDGAALSLDEIEEIGFQLIAAARQRRAMLADMAAHNDQAVTNAEAPCDCIGSEL